MSVAGRIPAHPGILSCRLWQLTNARRRELRFASKSGLAEIKDATLVALANSDVAVEPVVRACEERDPSPIPFISSKSIFSIDQTVGGLRFHLGPLTAEIDGGHRNSFGTSASTNARTVHWTFNL